MLNKTIFPSDRPIIVETCMTLKLNWPHNQQALIIFLSLKTLRHT